MDLTWTLRRFALLRHKVTALAAGLVLYASLSHLAAQTPRFAYAQPQVVPSTEGGDTWGSVAVDRAGNLYLTNINLGTVQRIPAGSSQLQPVDVHGVTNPLGIAVDPAGDLFIANDSATPQGLSTSSIIKYTPSGSQSTVGSGWFTPASVAADGLGNVYVLDSGPFDNAPVVYEVPAGTNTPVPLPIYGLVDPQALAADAAGDVFITDWAQGTLIKLAAGASSAQIIASGISSAWAVTTDIAGDVFYVNGASVGEIAAGSTTPTTAYVWEISPSNSSNQLLPEQSLAVDANGNLFFTANQGSYFLVAEVPHVSVDFGTADICVPGWNTVSSCTSSQTVWMFTAGDSTPNVQFVEGGAPSTEFSGTYQPGACDPSYLQSGYGCSMLVTFSPKYSGARSAQMQVRDTSGNLISSTLLSGIGSGPQVVYGPAVQSTVASQPGLQDIAVDSSGNVFATQPSTHLLIEFPAAGGGGQALANNFSYPFGVAPDGLGNVYVADALYSQLIRVSPNGSETVVSQNLNTPEGVAVDRLGNVFVADHADNRIVKVSPIGNAQTTVNGGAWTYPIAVAVDGLGNIYAADGPSGAAARKVTMLNPSTGVASTLSSAFPAPCGIAVDAAGDVYVADTTLHSVVEVPVGGGSQVTLGSGMANPCGIGVDPRGNVYVADSGNSRLLKESLSTVPALAFASTEINSTSSDSPQSVQVSNVGNAPLVAASGLANGANFAEVASPSGTSCGPTFWLEPGVSCEMSFSFTPTAFGPLSTGEQVATNGNPDFVTIPLSGTGLGAPASITALSGSGQTATYGSAFSSPLAAVVKDSAGNPVVGAQVSFSGTGISFSSPTATTGPNGQASVMVTALAAGSLTVTATTSGVTPQAAFALTANKALLNVIAGNASRAYGAANPTFAYTLAGFVNGDTQTVVSGSALLSTTATGSSPVGSYPITAALGTLAASNYTFNFIGGTLTVAKATPSINWPAPAAIVYGTPLGATQLDANSTVAGAFAYSPAAGTVLPTGSQTLSVTLTPTDTVDYTAASATTTLAVQPMAPAVTLSPSSLAFGSVTVGTSGGSLSATLTNTGNAPLAITSIAMTGANPSSFVFANSCGSTLAAGANCSIHGHFAPTAAGAMTAAITIADNADNSPQTIALSGAGSTSAAVSLSPASLSFGSVALGTSSGSQSVTLTNTGTAPLAITGINVTGANASSFVFANSCGSTLAPGVNCSIHGHFAPAAAGAMTAAITITDNAPDSPQTVAMSGAGIATPVVSLSAASIDFGSVPMGTSSGSQSVTLTNTGNGALSIAGITLGGANASSFVFANSCGSSLAAGASCSIHGHFAPAAAGALSAAITITDNSPVPSTTIPITGTGSLAQ